ncbi:unnamed protein product [Lactuca saligna]|uniref:Uncharacterized protein n=1 Tax=Lactuca saligna TaxID=75948 RepID=A0AA35Y9J7_LACSI|nr:unnamed protein product [Lactuca saligna]
MKHLKQLLQKKFHLLRRKLSCHPKFRDLNQEAPKSTQGTLVIFPINNVTNTIVSSPLYIIPNPSITYSRTFTQILNQPFTTLFSSQFTDPPKSDEPPTHSEESENEDTEFGCMFTDLEFDEEEENFPDHMLMSMKQFKIMNKKLNSVTQSQVDMGGNSESQLLEKVDHSDQNNELGVNSQASKFMGAVKELKQVAKERHTLFSLDVKKVIEDENFKLQELLDDM